MARIKLYQRNPANRFVGVPPADNSGAIIANAVSSSANLLADQANQQQANDQYMARFMLNQATSDIGQQLRQGRAAQERADKQLREQQNDAAVSSQSVPLNYTLDQLYTNARKQGPYAAQEFYKNQFKETMETFFRDNPEVNQRPDVMQRLWERGNARAIEHQSKLNEFSFSEGNQVEEKNAGASLKLAVEQANVGDEALDPHSLGESFRSIDTAYDALLKTSGSVKEAQLKSDVAKGEAAFNWLYRGAKEKPKETLALMGSDAAFIQRISPTDRSRIEQKANAQLKAVENKAERDWRTQKIVNDAEDNKEFSKVTVFQDSLENESALLDARSVEQDRQTELVKGLQEAQTPEDKDEYVRRIEAGKSRLSQIDSWLGSITRQKNQIADKDERAKEKEIKAKEEQLDTSHIERYKKNKSVHDARQQEMARIQLLTQNGYVKPEDLSKVQGAIDRFLSATTAIEKEGVQTPKRGLSTTSFDKATNQIRVLQQELKTKGKDASGGVIETIYKNLSSLNRKAAVGKSENVDLRTTELQNAIESYKDAYRAKNNGQDPPDSYIRIKEARENARLKQKYGADY